MTKRQWASLIKLLNLAREAASTMQDKAIFASALNQAIAYKIGRHEAPHDPRNPADWVEGP